MNLSTFSMSVPKDHLVTVVDMYNHLIRDNRYVRCRVDTLDDLLFEELSTNNCLEDGPIAVVCNYHTGFVIQKPHTKQQLMVFRTTYGTKLFFFGGEELISMLSEIPRGKLVQYLIDQDWLQDVVIRRTQVTDDNEYMVNKT